MLKTKTNIVACVLFLFGSLFFYENLYSQKKITFDLGIENSLPLGRFKTYYNYGIGATADVNLRLSPIIRLYFSASYLKYFINSRNLGFGGSEGFMPMVIGTKVMILPKFYLLAGGGINLDFGNVIDTYKMYRIGIGREIPNRLAVELKYERTGQYDFTPKVLKLGATVRL